MTDTRVPRDELYDRGYVMLSDKFLRPVLRVTHDVDLDLCLHCTTHKKDPPRLARRRGGWCRKCREYHRDPRKRNRDGSLRCPVCTTPRVD